MIRGLLFVVLSWTFIGLAAAEDSPYRAPWDIDVREGYTLEKQTLTDREIPAILFWKNEHADATKPIVFLLHGGGMPDVTSGSDRVAKELWFLPEFYGVPYTLADGGVLVVMIDQWWAGERFKPEYRDVVNKNYLGSVIRGFVGTTQDISLVIDALAKRHDADTERVGVTGRSGGGIVSLMAAANDPRVVAVTSWVGEADLVEVAKTKMPEAMARLFLMQDPELNELLEQYDPIHRLDAMAPTAVLMINNETDPSIPIEVVRRFYDTLAPHYASAPDLLEFRVMTPSQATHDLTREDYAAGCAWLLEHLRADATRVVSNESKSVED
jgi:dienelactone hydrolase